MEVLPEVSESAHTRTSSPISKPSWSTILIARGAPTKDFILGIVLLLIVVFLWTLSNFVTQALFQDGYDKPFLLTYLNTSAFALYLLPFLARRRRRQIPGSDGQAYSRRLAGNEYRPIIAEPNSEIEEHAEMLHSDDTLLPLTTRQTVDLALMFCFLWFIANWFINASLNYTSVASATILSATSGFFTLGIGRFFLVEIITPTKIVAVFTSFLGVILVSISDYTLPKEPAPQLSSGRLVEHPLQPGFGDFLALISAIFYATYVILLKVRISYESRIDMQLFFGFVGLFNILGCWPIGIVLHLTGSEPFEIPVTNKAIGAIIINMFITLTSDYLYILAMLKTTPLVVTVGLSLTIPLAVIGDFFLGRSTRGQVIVGAFLVLISFIAVGIDDLNAGKASSDKPNSRRDRVASGN